MSLSILYRGSLSSCNYDCHYCPFAKQHDTAAELKRDRTALERFADWVVENTDRDLGILFTPWGEALTRRWYREAMIELSKAPHVGRVAVQTNLALDPDWISDGSPEHMGLWSTYHPSQVDRGAFLARVHRAKTLGASVSVGMVALRIDFEEIRNLRNELDPEIYLWLNAAKSVEGEYTTGEIELLSEIDPLFVMNTRYHDSFGRPCGAGETSISVDADGNVRRCHFVGDSLGNLYEDNLDAMLDERLCPLVEGCGCHIGYVHLKPLRLDRYFRKGILERVPDSLPNSSAELVDIGVARRPVIPG